MLTGPKEQHIKDNNYPIILHACFDLPDFEKYEQKLLELVDFFEHKEVIIHPICQSEPITEKTVFSLAEKLQHIHKGFSKRGVKLYVENNSIMDVFFNTVDELRVVFDANPDIGLLLDLAHINDYDHLRSIVNMRYPECIHIADKHFGVPHEHIALGDGDMDFDMVFSEIIPNYQGRVILEAINSKEEIRKSNLVIDRLFRI